MSSEDPQSPQSRQSRRKAHGSQSSKSGSKRSRQPKISRPKVRRRPRLMVSVFWPYILVCIILSVFAAPDSLCVSHRQWLFHGAVACFEAGAYVLFALYFG